MNIVKNVSKLNIAPIVKKLELKNYNPDDPALDEEFFYVWVNLPKSMHDRWETIQIKIRATAITQDALQREYIEVASEKGTKSREAKAVRRRIDEHVKNLESVNEEMMAWYSEVWSQHKDTDTHFSADEVNEFAHKLMVLDEGLWAWITNQTQALILAHVNPQLKN